MCELSNRIKLLSLKLDRLSQKEIHELKYLPLLLNRSNILIDTMFFYSPGKIRNKLSRILYFFSR